MNRFNRVAQIAGFVRPRIPLSPLDPIMRRKRFRIIVCSLLAPLTFAGSPSSGGVAPTKKDEVTDRQDAGVNRIANAIENLAAVNVDSDIGCSEHHEVRNSDLCAQWKSADASRDAANYSLFAVILSFIGTCLLAVTFWEQRKVARAQLRAYVAVLPEVLQFDFSTGMAELTISLKNNGQTPAFGLVHAGNLVIRSERKMQLDMEATIKSDDPPKGVATSLTVNAGQESAGILSNHTAFTKEEIAAAVSGERSLFVFGSAFYRDAFGRTHETQFCYKFENLKKPPNDGRKRKAPGSWLLMPYFNEAS